MTPPGIRASQLILKKPRARLRRRARLVQAKISGRPEGTQDGHNTLNWIWI
jgi:hypothetical protein